MIVTAKELDALQIALSFYIKFNVSKKNLSLVEVLEDFEVDANLAYTLEPVETGGTPDNISYSEMRAYDEQNSELLDAIYKGSYTPEPLPFTREQIIKHFGEPFVDALLLSTALRTEKELNK